MNRWLTVGWIRWFRSNSKKSIWTLSNIYCINMLETLSSSSSHFPSREVWTSLRSKRNIYRVCFLGGNFLSNCSYGRSCFLHHIKTNWAAGSGSLKKETAYVFTIFWSVLTKLWYFCSFLNFNIGVSLCQKSVKTVFFICLKSDSSWMTEVSKQTLKCTNTKLYTCVFIQEQPETLWTSRTSGWRSSSPPPCVSFLWLPTASCWFSSAPPSTTRYCSTFTTSHVSVTFTLWGSLYPDVHCI